MSKRWETLHKFKVKSSRQRRGSPKAAKLKIDDLIRILLNNRGIKTEKEIREFLDPQLSSVTISSVGIDKKQLKRVVDRIKRAIDKLEQIVVYGDYDVDGICGTAILWETLYDLGAKVLPYIPHRVDEGYGLSIKGIENCKLKIENCVLIITVDNGIVASEAVEFANKNGIDVIITDHHVPGKKLPKAHAIVHTTKLCGAGVAWMLAQEILSHCHSEGAKRPRESLPADRQGRFFADAQNDITDKDHLGLVALATIADLVPLTGANRVLTKYGLEVLRKTKRVGIVALCKEAGIDQPTIDTYEVGHIIAPRLNAMGRLEYAMESLRLLCTKDKEKARALAHKLGLTNRERQLITQEAVLHAVTGIRNQESFDKTQGKLGIRKLLFVAHGSYQQGVIGLVAGKLVEEFYRPAIVVSIAEQYSKASARSIHGFNIIEFIRSASEFLVDAGGHPMAAGFTVETAKLSLLQKALEERVNLTLDDTLLTRSLRVDCEFPLSLISNDLYEAIQKLVPFGMGNQQPTFVSRNVIIEDMRLVGKEGKHLKFRLSCHPEGAKRPKDLGILRFAQNDKEVFDAIAFGMGERSNEFKIGDSIDVVYAIDMNAWNGSERLQLKVKDIAISS